MTHVFHARLTILMSSLSNMKKIGIIGIGNPLRKDDGIGIYLLERLRKDKDIAKKNLELIDGGTGGFSLIHDLKRFDTILIIDAVNFEGKPSGHKLIDLNDVKSKKGKVDFSTHESDLLNIINISKELKEIPESIFVFAIQPKSVDFGEGFCDEIKKNIDKIFNDLKKEIDKILVLK